MPAADGYWQFYSVFPDDGRVEPGQNLRVKGGNGLFFFGQTTLIES